MQCHDLFHLDVKLDNVGVRDRVDPTAYPVAVLMDFGCVRRALASQGYTQRVGQDVQPWGNPAHVAPELQLALKRARREGTPADLNFSKQPAFELGVLAFEVCAGEHPLAAYPAQLRYTLSDGPSLPAEYSSELSALCRSLVRCVGRSLCASVCGRAVCAVGHVG
jgi:hypothetical protein